MPSKADDWRSISGFAGWQAEYHIYFVGLDLDEKCQMAEDQIKVSFVGPKSFWTFAYHAHQLLSTSSAKTD
jgi:hypothetical protein